MANYKTPGVYIKEIPKFPPSVAQVETAIPAFIGYTEKAEKTNGDSLLNTPKRITSLLEYETFFGGAAKEDTITVEITDVVTDGDTERSIRVNPPTTRQPYNLYYAMQLYFANGGGPCYITSIGDYSGTSLLGNAGTTPLLDDMTDGLGSIRKEDEPTLLLFPDATSLSSDSDFWAIYNAALTQCNQLQDRFTIIDTYSDEDYVESASTDTVSPDLGLRNGITLGTDYTKYGAAYYPFLETILNFAYDESSIEISHVTNEPNAVPTALASINSARTLLNATVTDLRDRPGLLPSGTFPGSLVDVINYMHNDMDVLNTGDYTLATSEGLIDLLELALEDLQSAMDSYNTAVADAKAVIASVSDNNVGVATTLQGLLDTFKADFDGTTNKIEENTTKLEALLDKLKADDTDGKRQKTVKTGTTSTSNIYTQMAELLVYTVTPAAPTTPITSYDTITTDAFQNVITNLDALITEINNADLDVVDTNNGDLNGRLLGDISSLDNATYNKIKTEINNLPLTLPPSSAMAGIYARVDATRGVWKAPANVGLTYVVRPTVQITHEEQGDLNVHTTGKSINAIRSFTGKGTLVWGARTLAGNDNEWRYVPVRRFFNMVEESVSKATEQFVFESNDSNTWVKVRAMIENFLILQWKAGALAGAKAEQAFYVRVGLGQTMTAQDILEGRMIIEIGMAVVRPAEFIILRFSHKMQEA